MYFLLLEATPRPGSDAYGTTDGAYAACWAAASDAVVAESQVRAFLETIGWDTDVVEEVRAVERDEFLGKPDSLALFDQAVTDGVVITLHRWPVGAPEEPEDDPAGEAG